MTLSLKCCHVYNVISILFYILYESKLFVNAVTYKDIKAELKKVNIIPDIIDSAPKQDIQIQIDGISVDLGNKFTLNPLVNPPKDVKWETEAHGIYTFIVTGPDVPSWDDPYEREYLHWLIVNIPGNNYSKGETIATYIGSQYCCNIGIHRMVYTVWKQPQSKPMNFAEERRIDNSTHYVRRAFFNSRKFSQKYNMTLWAVNYLIIECCLE